MEEQEIINLMKEDPEAGIHEAMNRYGGAVETICRNFLFDCQPMDIEEAVADSFVKLWKAKDRIKISKDKSLKSYLYEIARNTARDKRRTLKREKIFSIEEVELQLYAPLNVEEDYARKSNENILHECLNQTEEPDRSVFILRYFYGEKVKEIADRLKLTPKKVENILYRGKEKLEQALKERGIFRESY
jgi:RNA polymerase sigma factor, sigma-70 family